MNAVRGVCVGAQRVEGKGKVRASHPPKISKGGAAIFFSEGTGAELPGSIFNPGYQNPARTLPAIRRRA